MWFQFFYFLFSGGGFHNHDPSDDPNREILWILAGWVWGLIGVTAPSDQLILESLSKSHNFLIWSVQCRSILLTPLLLTSDAAMASYWRLKLPHYFKTAFCDRRDNFFFFKSKRASDAIKFLTPLEICRSVTRGINGMGPQHALQIKWDCGNDSGIHSTGKRHSMF